MAVTDDVAAVRAREDLTDDETRVEVSRVKAVALRDVLAASVGSTYAFDGYDFTITRNPQTKDGNLYLWLTIEQDGTVVFPTGPDDLPVIVVNPPIISRRTGQENLLFAAREIIRDLVG